MLASHMCRWEQASLVQYYNISQEARDRIKFIPQKAMNSYPRGHICPPELKYSWTPGDFVVHFPGTSDQNRTDWFEEYLPQVLRHG